MENNKNLQDFYKSVIDINGQLLEMKINTAKGYLSEKDAQMMASLLEQQLKQLLLANSKVLPRDEGYRNSLKGLKEELHGMTDVAKLEQEDVAKLEQERDQARDQAYAEMRRVKDEHRRLAAEITANEEFISKQREREDDKKLDNAQRRKNVKKIIMAYDKKRAERAEKNLNILEDIDNLDLSDDGSEFLPD